MSVQSGRGSLLAAGVLLSQTGVLAAGTWYRLAVAALLSLAESSCGLVGHPAQHGRGWLRTVQPKNKFSKTDTIRERI